MITVSNDDDESDFAWMEFMTGIILASVLFFIVGVAYRFSEKETTKEKQFKEVKQVSAHSPDSPKFVEILSFAGFCAIFGLECQELKKKKKNHRNFPQNQNQHQQR